MTPRTAALTAMLATALSLPACAVHVHEDRAELDETQCSVACPARGHANAECVSPQIAACTCEPVPVATCTGSRGS